MTDLKRFERTLNVLFVISQVLSVAFAYLVFYSIERWLDIGTKEAIAASAIVWVFITFNFASRHTIAALRPISSMYMALSHMSIGPSNSAPPKPTAHGISRKIVESVLEDVYKLSSDHSDAHKKTVTSKIFAESILNLQSNMIIVLDENQKIIFANHAASEQMHKTVADPLGLSINDVYDLELSSGLAIDKWIEQSKADKIQNRYLWEKARIGQESGHIRYFDVVADYNKAESHGAETLIVMFDKTDTYHDDDDSLSFISLAVHELRSPISLIRGYIEAFEDELGSSLDDEQRSFMQKMSVAAKQLSTFTNNILNVARIENNQLKIHIHEDTIYDALETSKEDFNLRATVRNRNLIYEVADGIPSVGLDRVGFYEVLSNLIDNAIKYSHDGDRIIIGASLNANNQISVTVQDFGVGIAKSSMENLFEQYYRAHHSRDKVAGTGLGLFLSKTIVEAHGGNIWVKSKEGVGSTFGFDLPTYADLNKDGDVNQSSQANEEIVRTAHGWIKNHGNVRK